MTPDHDEFKVTVREAFKDDVVSLGPRLRPADRTEVMALGSDPESALYLSWDSSPQRYAIVKSDGTCIGIFGVGPAHHMSENLGMSVGCVWMLGSSDLKHVRYSFLRQCREWVEALERNYDVLWNWADARNALHLKWLEWLGFKIIGTAQIGKSGELFHQFIKVK
jgi:hypothetical protein